MKIRVFSSLFALSIFFTLHLAKADQLTVYVYPSPLGIDWRTPNALAWSAIANELYEDKSLLNIHDIGHMNFDLKCDPSEDLPSGAHIETGQTNSDDGEMRTRLLNDEYGIGIMLSNYKGRWETSQEIETDLPVRFKKGEVDFINFQIKPSTCARVVAYLKEYQQKGYDQIYGGLQNRPRKGEGAGCSAFTEGVMEIAGLMTPEWNSYWTHFLYVPTDVIGGPLTGNHVSLLDDLLGFDTLSWNSSPKNSFALTFWDPYSVYSWIQYAWKKPTKLTGLTYSPVKNQKAKGLAIDATAVPTPSEPFWLSSN